jgi:beta-galactosidase
MGFVVLDEIFDEWVSEKVPQGIHLFWPEWHEANVRSFIRRDRNHPSVVIWSVGNEVPEQRTGAAGAAIAQELVAIAHEEDGTRQVTEGMNSARPNEPFITPFDIISLNYQGDGIRDTPAYSHLNGSSIPPSYPAFHAAYPEKMILSSETASSVSTRGTYLFPVVSVNSAPVNDTSGGNSTTRQVSAYELYSADWGASADKVFAAQDSAPYVAGEFVWSGFDYLGEPTPYESSRSSYFGIVDLAGFRKDRFYLYQARWNAAVKVLHILPHWTWPDRVGQVTPVHVFTGAEEVELFVNGKSQGRKRRAPSTYRVRWDNVTYEAGNVRAVGYMNGTAWANATVETAGAATQLSLTADRTSITADGLDLSYITVEVKDSKGNVVPEADNAITFTVSGGADIVATDNGNPYDFTVFPSKERKAFSGLALAIVRANAGVSGSIKVTASAQGLRSAEVTLEAQ